ncbi:hypothetical protein HD554DRAFT_1294508 [Boletus coccyginus]|nr:hypothetical protein HD554DRAFT_1294508 [Boletus coccyginus]
MRTNISELARIHGTPKRPFRFGAVEGRSVAARDGYKGRHPRFTYSTVPSPANSKSGSAHHTLIHHHHHHPQPRPHSHLLTTMTSASALVDIALLLLQNMKEGLETGQIANVNTAQTEVEAAMAELNRRRLLEGPTDINDLVGKMLLEIGSLHEKVAKCESQLSEFQSRTDALKEETTQIVARTEVCNSLVKQQQTENVKVLAAMEGAKASISTAPPPCAAPAPSPTDPISRPAPSRTAVISFPGGPRTITIHPPDSPSYQSIIRDEKGDVIIALKGTKPLRREGAFRGPLEDIDWREISRVYGRGPETPIPRAAPPVPRWPDQYQPSSCPPPPRGPSEIIARQRQLSTSMQTDAFGRVLAPEYPTDAKPPSGPTSTSSPSESSQDSQSSSNAKPENFSTTPSSTPPSPSVGRGKKRTRHSEEDEGVPPATETREGVPLLVDVQTVKEPTTPTPVKRGESHPPEGPAKRKKLRSSESLEALSTGSLSRTHSLLDLTRTV